MHIQIDRSHYIWAQLAVYKQAAQSGTLQGQLVLEEKDWSSGPPETMEDFLGPLDTKL